MDHDDPVNLKKYARKISKALKIDNVKFQVQSQIKYNGQSNPFKEPDRFNIRDITYVEGALFQVIGNNRLISQFYLQQMPACCGICVLTGSWVDYAYRKKGVATILAEVQKELAYYAGYTALVCTDVASNIPQKKVLKKNGWKDLWRFQNKRTGNFVDISVTDLDSHQVGKPLFGDEATPIARSDLNKDPLDDFVQELLSILMGV